MPAVYVRMLAYAWGEPVASRTCLLGETFSPTEAHALGMVHELVPAEELLDRAVAVAEQTPEDCLEQYAFTKRACQAAALRDIADTRRPTRRRASRRDDQRPRPACPPALLAAAQRPSGAVVSRTRRRAAPGLDYLAAQAVSRRQPAAAARPAAGARRQRLRRPRRGDGRVGTRAHRPRRTGREHPLALRPRRRQRAASGGGRWHRGQRPGRPGPRPPRSGLLPSRVPRPAGRPYTVDEPLDDGQILRLGDADWQVVRTPGHTPGHLSLWQPQERLLVVGDALSDYDVGWVNLALDGPDAAATALAFAAPPGRPRPACAAAGARADPRRPQCRVHCRVAPRPASRRRPSRGGLVRRAADLRVRPDDP